MQYTPHYNLNLPEGTDIVNPLIQDNPNYSAIDNALYNNKLRVIGTATHTKTGTNHSIVLADSDISVFRFVATGDWTSGDTMTVDGNTVTPKLSDGTSLPTGCFVINSEVIVILNGSLATVLISGSGVKSFNNRSGAVTPEANDYDASEIEFTPGGGITASNVNGAIREAYDRVSYIDINVNNTDYVNITLESSNVITPGNIINVCPIDIGGTVVFTYIYSTSVYAQLRYQDNLSLRSSTGTIRVFYRK